MTTNPYLGQAVKYPYEVDVFGKITYESAVNLIKQSINILFTTPIGTEFYREHYGSEVRMAMFEPNDLIAQTLLDYYLIDAISKWEKRIKILDIEYEYPESQPDLINCRIIFRVRQSSEIDSFVYPFYRELKN